MSNKESILNLKEGEKYIWPESDYGKAEIWRINDIFILFGIPMYGGYPIYEKCYPISYIDDLIKNVESWT